jgi:hypothetical protein
MNVRAAKGFVYNGNRRPVFGKGDRQLSYPTDLGEIDARTQAS